ncbi:MAG: KpsF/GutQ family sugar-phosphate isomerase [Proteobacteria bacterium]|nr:KpsF/GutQ family sugar-phosphate isomerase [Pseudomonadota bacterium]
MADDTGKKAGSAEGPNEAILARGRAVLAAEAQAIQEAHSHLGDAFVAAVRTLLACRGRVCVTGIGKAGLIGAKIQATLASTGTPAYGLHPVEALHGDLGMVHRDDVVIALSKSGGSELVQLLPRLRRLGCRILLLTAEPDSPAAEHADDVLFIGDTAEACPLGLAPSSSTASMLALGDALALTVMEQKAVAREQYAAYHPGGALGRSLLRAHEIMRKGADCPRVGTDATLGECYEAILKAPRRAGAGAVVDDDGRLVGIVTQGDFFRLFQDHERLLDQPVQEHMSRDPKRVSTQASVMEALNVMRRHSIDEIPVVGDDDRLAGLIDIQDLVAQGFSVFDTR